MPLSDFQSKPVTPPFTPTSEQAAIWDLCRDSKDHLMIYARAGCGKTTVLEYAMQYIKTTCGFMAFGTDIVGDLKKRLPMKLHRHIRTFHSFGRGAIDAKRKSESINTQLELDKKRVYSIMSDLAPTWNIHGRWPKGTRPQYKVGVSLTKNQFPIPPQEIDPADVTNYLSNYLNIERVSSTSPAQMILDIMAQSLDYTGSIDYDDMIYIPLALDMPIQQYGTLLIDEAQDLNHSQHLLVQKAGKRYIAVGDDRQAIYAFRGAYSDSMDRLNTFMDQSRPVKKLPLTVTQRCPKNVVAVAQSLVPDIKAREDAIDGKVSTITKQQMLDLLKPGAMVICRTNRPIVELTFFLWKLGIKAYVRGREFGEELLQLVRSWNTSDLTTLKSFLDHYQKTKTEEFESEDNQAAITHLNDKCDVIRYFLFSVKSYDEFETKIFEVFKDYNEDNAIQLCTAHKAKGLEANDVFIVNPELMPHPKTNSPEEYNQELNLLYVAITRAKTNLYFVGTTPELLNTSDIQRNEIDELQNEFREAVDKLLS